jgi:hypothetical protein
VTAGTAVAALKSKRRHVVAALLKRGLEAGDKAAKRKK